MYNKEITIKYMDNQEFKAIIEKDEDGFYVASVPAVPGCHSQGSTFEEALQNIQEALDLCLETASSDPDYKAKINYQASKVFSIVDVPVLSKNA